MTPTLIDLDAVLDTDVQVKFGDKTFKCVTPTLKEVGELTRRNHEVLGGKVANMSIAQQFHYLFSPVFPEMKIEDLEQMTNPQAQRLYRLVLERIAGHKAADLVQRIEAHPGSGEKKKMI